MKPPQKKEPPVIIIEDDELLASLSSTDDVSNEDAPPEEDDDALLVILPDDVDLDTFSDPLTKESVESVARPPAEPVRPAPPPAQPSGPTPTPARPATRPQPARPARPAAAEIPRRVVQRPAALHPEPVAVAEPESAVSAKRRRSMELLERARIAAGIEVDEALIAEVEDEISREEESLEDLFSAPRVYGVIVFVAVSLLLTLVVVGQSYYVLPISQRSFHYFHETLRPSGTLGLFLGISGTLLMLASLTYLGRKGLLAWRRLGSVQSWMAFHIFTGLLGPALIVFHSAFAPHSGLGAFAFFAMLIVVCTGVLGRYIFVYVPRSLEGRELEFEVVRQRLVVYRKKLAAMGVNPRLLRIDEAEKKREQKPWLITAVIRVIYGDRQSKQEFIRLRDAVRSDEELKSQMDRTLLLVQKLCRERQWLVRYQELRKLMGAWRFVHRWLAIALFVLVFFHVMISLNFGNLWIFGGGS